MMEIKKTFERVMSRVAGQVESRIQKVDLDSLLAAVGLQVAKHRRSMSLPLLAAFGSGVAVGVLLAPVSGKDLRGKIALLMGKLKQSGRAATDGAAQEVTDTEAVESPIERATRLQHVPAGSNGQRKSPRQDEAGAPSAAS